MATSHFGYDDRVDAHSARIGAFVHELAADRDFGERYWRLAGAPLADFEQLSAADVDRIKFRQLADNLPSLCWIANADGYIVWYNRRWHQYCGTTPEEMEGWGWQAVHDPAMLQTVLDRWRRAIDVAEPFEMVFPLRGADGVFRPFLTRFVPIRDEAGTVRRWIGNNVDISEQRRIEIELRDTQHELRRLNESLGVEVEERTIERDQLWELSQDLLVVADYEGRLLRVSQSWLDLTGLSKEQLHTDEYTQITHPDDVPSSMAKVLAMRETGAVTAFENRILGPDGWHWIAWTLSPAVGEDRFTGVGRDVTAQKDAQAALSDTQDFARLALSAVGGVGVWTYDVASDRFFCDAAVAELYALVADSDGAGFTRPEFLANVHPDDAVGLRKTMSDGLVEVGELELEYRIVHPDGSMRWVLSRGHTYFDERNLPVRRTGIGIDMTRQRLLEEQLRQSQKMETLGQLTGGIAHDFNNLLTVIRGSADLLRRPDVSGEKRQRYVEAIADTADRATKLTSQLLSFARRQSLKPEVFDVGESLRSLEGMLATLTGSRIDVAIDVADCPCEVSADRSQFDTAIINMTVNARDAMNGVGRLTIAVTTVDEKPALRLHPRARGKFVTVRISDTGEGIATSKLDQIFEPFFTTKDVGQGTGLGLSQVFGFAKQSDGDIVAESDEGLGASFTLYLPAARAAVDRPAPDIHEAGTLSGEGARILLVEDNQEVGTFVVQALAELEYRTVLAADASSALAELDREGSRFDAVFSDVVMPGMNGIDLAKEIHRLYPELPVVLTSGYSSVLAEHGSAGFELLRKPYSVEALSAVLRKAVDRR